MFLKYRAGEHAGMGISHFRRLLLNCVCNFLNTVPYIYHDRPARCVDVALTICVPQVDTLPVRDGRLIELIFSMKDVALFWYRSHKSPQGSGRPSVKISASPLADLLN